jgi:hypothetical protein
MTHPRVAEGDDKPFAEPSDQAGTYLYPIGHADSGDSYLGMAALWNSGGGR